MGRADAEVETHDGLGGGLGLLGAHLGGAAAGAGGLAVEGEGHGVEQGGLARAGGAGDEEKIGAAQVGEVEGLARGVGTEGFEGETEGAHQAEFF